MNGYNPDQNTWGENVAYLQHTILYAPAAIAIFDVQMCYLAVNHKCLEEYHLKDDIIGGNKQAVLIGKFEYETRESARGY